MIQKEIGIILVKGELQTWAEDVENTIKQAEKIKTKIPTKTFEKSN